jgi:hypothetical protein
MTTTADSLRPPRVQFWRWLVPILIVFAVANYDASVVTMILLRPLAPKSIFQLPVIPISISSTEPGLLYSLTLLLNLFFVQRCDRVAGNHPWLRLLAGAVLLIAAAIASAGVALILLIGYFRLVYVLPAWLTRVPEPVAFCTGAIIVGAFFGGALGLLHRFLGADTGRMPGLMKAHLWAAPSPASCLA